jgi:hypothetical protein
VWGNPNQNINWAEVRYALVMYLKAVFFVVIRLTSQRIFAVSPIGCRLIDGAGSKFVNSVERLLICRGFFWLCSKT